MNRYSPIERICNGYFGTDHRVRELKHGRKERLVKSVPCGGREFAMRVLNVYKDDVCLLPKHDHVVKVIDVFIRRQQSTTFLCSVSKTNCDDQLLNEYLTQKHKGLGDESLKILFIQMASGLGFLHSNGIAHNALTAYSVVMTKFHNGDAVAKLTDYGMVQFCLQSEVHEIEKCRQKSLMFALPPEAFAPNWGRKFNSPNKAADLFMLGMLINATVEHSLLPADDGVEIIGSYLPFPGYGSIPIGKFLHSNQTVDLHQQLFHTASDPLRRLLRRLSLIDGAHRPAPTGIIRLLNASQFMRRPSQDTEPDVVRLRMSKPLLNTTNLKRKSSLRFDPLGGPDGARKRSMMSAPANEWEKSSSEAVASLVRRASLRLSEKAKSVSDYLNQKKSMKITD